MSNEDRKLSEETGKSEVVNFDEIEPIENNLLPELINDENSKYYRAILSAALGSIPWIGGVFSALIALQAESEQHELNELQKMWLYEHRDKIAVLSATLNDITSGLDEFSTHDEVKTIVQNRIKSPEYIGLVRETFRAWDEASTADKREQFKKLITNAAAIELCTDDMVRIFIKWIAQYHEYHLQIIGEVYNNPGISLGSIWDNLFDENNEGRPRENSAKADLYRTLIRDLNMGGVIRQQRNVNSRGEFLKKSTKRIKKASNSSDIMKSSFADDDELELSELGGQFVQYVLQDLVPQLENKN